MEEGFQIKKSSDSTRGKPGQAYAWSHTRMGSWAVAQSPILSTTITKEKLKKAGYVSLVEY
jgi:hypothetical protein